MKREAAKHFILNIICIFPTYKGVLNECTREVYNLLNLAWMSMKLYLFLVSAL
jgi:hypothetical protein